MDGLTEARRGTVSVFNGPAPAISVAESSEAEIAEVGSWIRARLAEEVSEGEMAVFVRSSAELPRAEKALEAVGVLFHVLDERLQTGSGRVSVGTMHLAKGLEFRAAVVMACDDEVTPSQSRIETIADEPDLEEVYNTECHLLYVACTRAREHLLVSRVDPVSEFLDDLGVVANSTSSLQILC